jgi:hypothetical protein
MPTISPTLTLSQPALTSTAATKAAVLASIAPPASPVAATKAPEPGTTVTLSPQAMSAMAAAAHPSPPPASSTSASSVAPMPAPAAHDGSVYDAVKNGITTAVTDVGDAIADGAHAVVEGVETTLSTAHDVAKGIVAFPFAAVSRASDAVGALIDKL